MRFRPFIATKGSRYQGRLDIVGFGAAAVDEVTPFFDTADEALEELLRRLRHMFQVGDEVEVRGAVYEDLDDAESELRASLPVARH